MIETPSVDVLLPFNSIDKYLDFAIRCVLASEDVTVNLFLIDDRLDDKFYDIAQHYPEAKFFRTNGIGYYPALNSVRTHLQSDYVALMNSDDVISATKYIEQIRVLNIDNSDLCVTHLRKFKGKFIILSKYGENSSQKFNNEYLLLGSYFANATWLAKRQFWQEKIIFGNEKMGDWALALHIFSKIKVSIVPKVHYWYRKHKNQVTANINFHQNSVNEIYPLWKNLSLDCNWPELTKNSFGLIAAPLTVAGTLSPYDVSQSIDWLLKLTNSEDEVVSALARRRYLYICAKYLNLMDPKKIKGSIILKASLEFFLEFFRFKRLLPRCFWTSSKC